MNHSLKTRGILLTVISTVGFSLYPILGKFIFTGGANFITTLFVRFALASLLFWFILYRTEGKPNLKPRQGLLLFSMGGIGYASMSGLYLTSVSYIPTSLAALMLYTYPILVTLLSLVTKQDSFAPAKILGVIISSIGLILVLGFNLKGINITGILLAVAASIVYSCYIVTGSFVLKEVSPLLSSAVITTSAALSYGLVGMKFGFTWHLSLSTWLGILSIALFCTVLAMFTFFYGVKTIGPTSASVISTLEPLMTFLFAALLFHERLTLLQGLGGILVLIGGLRAVTPKLAFRRATLYDRERI